MGSTFQVANWQILLCWVTTEFINFNSERYLMIGEYPNWKTILTWNLIVSIFVYLTLHPTDVTTFNNYKHTFRCNHLLLTWIIEDLLSIPPIYITYHKREMIFNNNHIFHVINIFNEALNYWAIYIMVRFEFIKISQFKKTTIKNNKLN